MKKGLVLVLLLLMALSGAAFASYFGDHEIKFIVNVEPWAKFDMPKQEVLNINNGSATGEVTVTGTVTANVPLKIMFEHVKFADSRALNDFFKFTMIRNDGNISDNTQVAGGTHNANARQGKTDLSVTLKVAIPQGKEWYDLTAGTYESIMTITIADNSI